MPPYKGKLLNRFELYPISPKLIERASRAGSTILIVGEKGTGKKLIAKAIHEYSGRRGRFICASCSTLSEKLLRENLRLSIGGTLLLEEVGELRKELQLQLLEEGREAGSSVVASTSADLEGMVRKGRFRKDLFEWIGRFRIDVPPLRERREEIPLLVERLIERFSEEFELPKKTLTEDALNWLKNYDFPGNLKELERIILKAMLVSPVDVIDVEDIGAGHSAAPNLKESIERFVSTVFTVEQKGRNNLYSLVIGTAEKLLIEKVLGMTGWNRKRASEILGIHRNTLRKRMRELGIENPEKRNKF